MEVDKKLYQSKDREREVTQYEKNTMFHVFIHDKKSVPEISKLFNLPTPRVEKVLFAKGNYKPYDMPSLREIIGFSKQTAYWETEQELIESFEPKYNPEDLKGWELERFETINKNK